ncbi:MAG: RNA 2',3'-cyclic phosphodiesterase [Candidatus Omnitrophota bacterium]
MSEIIRAFIAVPISDELKEEIKTLQSHLKEKLKGEIIWSNPGNTHLTLRFLGHVNQEQIEIFKNILILISKKIKSFTLDLGVLGAFPNLTRPRVIWIGINAGFNELNQINALLEEEFSQIGFGYGEKYFHPHLTLARIKSLDEHINFGKAIQNIRSKRIVDKIERLILFESTLTPQGPIHKKIFEQKLPKD